MPSLYIEFVSDDERRLAAVEEQLAKSTSSWVREQLRRRGACMGPGGRPMLEFAASSLHHTAHALEQVFVASTHQDLLRQLAEIERALATHPDREATPLRARRREVTLALPPTLALGHAESKLRSQLQLVAMACALGADAVVEIGCELLALRFAHLVALPDWRSAQCMLPARMFLELLQRVPLATSQRARLVLAKGDEHCPSAGIAAAEVLGGGPLILSPRPGNMGGILCCSLPTATCEPRGAKGALYDAESDCSL
jgi:hypothetical protein